MTDPISFKLKKHFDRYIHDPIAALIAIPLYLILKIFDKKNRYAVFAQRKFDYKLNLLNENIRDITNVNSGFSSGSNLFNEGSDYSVLENARKLDESEYSVNEQLGYIFLNLSINEGFASIQTQTLSHESYFPHS